MLILRQLLLSVLVFTILPAHAANEESQTLRIGTNFWPGYESFYLAQTLEKWDQSTEINVVEFSSATDVIRAFRNRVLEVATLTLDETLLLLESKLPITAVMVTDVSHGGDVIMAGPGIDRFKDIRGKRVGVEAGALGAYLLTRALEVHQLSLDDIEIIPLDVSAHETAFSEHQVDAIVTFEPIRTKLLALGAKEIFTSREIPGEVVDVVVVHNDFLKKHPEKVRELIEGWFKALTYLHDSPELAAQKISERLKITPQEALDSFDGVLLPSRAENLAFLGGNGRTPKLSKVVQNLQASMLSQGLLLEPVNTDNLFSAEFLAPIKKSGK
jgi:NitT/TauT family transport system substrate-binding protein